MTPGRTDRAQRLIHAPAVRLWQAWFGLGELAQWLPPGDMRGEVLALDPTEGGLFRMRLTYAKPGRGKTTVDSDLVEGRFVRIKPEQSFRLDTEFRSDDPAMAGTMKMTWTFEPASGGTQVQITCEDVPPGIGAEDHTTGLVQSLENLAQHVE